MRHFLVKYGFSRDEVISIDHTEIEKAIYAHLTGAKVAFKSGSVSGDKIISVTPDFHRELGWGYDHVLDGYDYKDLNHDDLQNKYRHFLGQMTEKVKYLMESGQKHLIGKNQVLPRSTPKQNLLKT